MKIALYGGAFDPIHKGHIDVIKALTSIGYPVWVFPAYVHPWGKNMAPFDVRLAWAAAATHELNNVEVHSDEEFNPSGRTAHLLTHLKIHYPGITFMPVIGEIDALKVPVWEDGDGLTENYQWIVVPRGCEPNPDGWYRKEPHIYLEKFQPVGTSSTFIREAILRQGDDPFVALPDEIRSSVLSSGLYRNQKPAKIKP